MFSKHKWQEGCSFNLNSFCFGVTLTCYCYSTCKGVCNFWQSITYLLLAMFSFDTNCENIDNAKGSFVAIGLGMTYQEQIRVQGPFNPPLCPCVFWKSEWCSCFLMKKVMHAERQYKPVNQTFILSVTLPTLTPKAPFPQLWKFYCL